ncbi:alpha/beta hydrolase [Streptomyces tirandamycinicus]|uniref:alpha/beta hydrolase n=1 Tax=Streptomyces tirandamycinicus TaxID=2174846 RepID=UPI002270FE63|nr:alpha/beta hydrolase [Streptomyces tirandamycinicus]MCY0984240.1 alpha/beta hydrolase [Streptomyces tirandamycinicus]
MLGTMTRRCGRILFMTGVLLISSTVSGGSAQAGPSHGRPPGEDVRVVLDWRPCTGEGQRGFECATARVPLDWARPRGRMIELAVIRATATEPGRRVGSLFAPAGGPGGSGTAYLPGSYEKFPEDVRKRFDLVSWDPRGVGQSTAVRCFDTAAEAIAFQESVPPFPVGKAERRAFIAAYAQLGKRCERRFPALLRHISTADSARDLDALREAVGERRMRLWGISYATFLGATYANMFPSRVARMLLDGNVNPQAWVNGGRKREPRLSTSLRLEADLGSAATLGQFLDLCGRAPTSGCAFSAGTAGATRAKFEELMRRLKRQPVGQWTYARAVSMVREGLNRVHPAWTEVADTLQSLWEGRPPEEPAPPPDPPYPGFEQFYAVACAESPNPRNPRQYVALDRLSTRRAGDLGHWWAWADEPCATWPAKAENRYTGPWDRPTAHPVLVVNPTYDPATPYQSAQAMVRQLHDARLLTLDGYGHTALENPSRCVNAYAARYFLTGALPRVGARCTQDVPPFTTPAEPHTQAPRSAAATGPVSAGLVG